MSFLKRKIQLNFSEMGKRSVKGRFIMKKIIIKLTVALSLFAKFIH